MGFIYLFLPWEIPVGGNPWVYPGEHPERVPAGSGKGGDFLTGALATHCRPFFCSGLPEEVLTLESTGGTEQYGSDFFETLRTLSGAVDKKRGQVQKAALGTDVLDYAERLSKMTIGAYAGLVHCYIA